MYIWPSGNTTSPQLSGHMIKQQIGPGLSFMGRIRKACSPKRRLLREPDAVSENGRLTTMKVRVQLSDNESWLRHQTQWSPPGATALQLRWHDDDTPLSAPTIDEAEIETDLLRILDVEYNNGLVDIGIHSKSDVDHLVVNGHYPRHPGCLAERIIPSRECVYRDGPHIFDEWANIRILPPPEGREPDQNYILGDTDQVSEIAQRSAYSREDKLRAEAHGYVLECIRPALTKVVDIWWAKRGRSTFPSLEEIGELGAEFLAGICPFEGIVDHGWRADDLDDLNVAPGFFDVLVRVEDIDEDIGYISLDFGYRGRDNSWYSLDDATLHIE